MMHITQRQMRTLNDACDPGRIDRIAQALRTFFAERFSQSTDEQVRDFARDSLRQARQRGLSTEGEALRYANLAALLGIGFEDTPAAHQAGLAPKDGEGWGVVWLRRAGDRVEQLLREREAR